MRCIRPDNQWSIYHFSKSNRLNKNYFQSKSNQVHSLAKSVHSNHMSLVLLPPLCQGYIDQGDQAVPVELSLLLATNRNSTNDCPAKKFHSDNQNFSKVLTNMESGHLNISKLTTAYPKFHPNKYRLIMRIILFRHLFVFILIVVLLVLRTSKD